MSAGKLIGVGVGPGDPELMTLKAMRALGEADVIAHFAKAGNESHSRAIAAQHLRAEVIELPLLYPSPPNCRRTATATVMRSAISMTAPRPQSPRISMPAASSP